MYYTIGTSNMKMHDIHLYLRYTNSYILFSDWRTEVRLHTATQFFHKPGLCKQKRSYKIGIP